MFLFKAAVPKISRSIDIYLADNRHDFRTRLERDLEFLTVLLAMAPAF